MKSLTLKSLLPFAGLALIHPALAADTALQASNAVATANPAPESAPMDYGFIAICCALVFIMQAGFCLIEMGFSRSKNAINIVMKNILDFAAGSIGFFLVGFALMFGISQSGWVGWQNFAFGNDLLGFDSGIWLFCLFQMMFATAAVTISSGAMAERTFFPGYLTYAFFACLLIYPILGHWVWGGSAVSFGFGGGKGWLAEMGFLDFAGSTAVHSVGGAFAFAGIIVVGPRKGRFSSDGSPRILSGHNAPLAALGCFLLIFGWFGFNMGSNLTTGPELGRIGLATILAGASGILGALLTHWIRNGWADMEISLNGALGGLVAITAGCAYVAPSTALIIGLIAGVLTALGGDLLLKMKLDDAVGAIPVHLFCGIWGTLAVAIFSSEGAFTGMGVQALGAFLVPTMAFALSYILFFIVNKTVGLRASDEAQTQGLDFAEHSATAYPDFVVDDADLDEE